LSYFEAVNKETLRNSYTRFKESQMVHIVKSKDSKVPPRIQLDPSWHAPRDHATGTLLAKGRLWDFTEKIARSRREGKNRRDGATVASRVLRLADDLGRKMFEEADAGIKVPSRISREETEALRRSLKKERTKNRAEGKPRL
jgi:hypothetical protein